MLSEKYQVAELHMKCEIIYVSFFNSFIEVKFNVYILKSLDIYAYTYETIATIQSWWAKSVCLMM